MLSIELTAEEVSTLQEILTTYVSDLRMEVAGTDRMELREALKARESLLKGLLARLEPRAA